MRSAAKMQAIVEAAIVPQLITTPLMTYITLDKRLIHPHLTFRSRTIVDFRGAISITLLA